VPQIERRAAEATRMGFESCLVPAAAPAPDRGFAAGVRPVDTLEEAISAVMPGSLRGRRG